jgi:hypothetical protein
MRFRGALLIVIVIAVALLLRLVGLKYGLPYVYNPDEVAIMSRTLAFAKGDLNPHNFLYPTLYFYVLFVWEGLTAAVSVATREVGSFSAFQREFFLDPTRVYVAGRLLTALLGTATVLATGRLAARLEGATAGVVAGLLLAVMPLHVLNSHYVKHDVPVTLCVVLACLAYERLWNAKDRAAGGGRRGSHELIVAAIVTGVAFATHYYAIFLAIPLAWAAAHSARDRNDALRRMALAACIAAAVFFTLSPFILVEPLTALRDIRANRQIVVDRAVEQIGYVGTAARYLHMMVSGSMGPLVFISALGALSAIVTPRTRARVLLLLSFPAAFVLFICSAYPASRYLVPLTPFIAIFGAVAFVRQFRGGTSRGVAAAAALSAVVLLAVWESARMDAFIRQTDTRTLAARYIESNIPAGSTVLTQPYSAPLTSTAEALREAVARNHRAMPVKTHLEIVRSPYPAPAYRVLYLGRGMDADKLYVSYSDVGPDAESNALRTEHVAFVVLKRYNGVDPATLPLLKTLAREGRRLAVFSPYRDNAAGGPRPEPFLHNTDARIDAALERPGPVVEIWQIDGPDS